nr:callose synthase 2-like [Ipomoea batatas]
MKVRERKGERGGGGIQSEALGFNFVEIKLFCGECFSVACECSCKGVLTGELEGLAYSLWWYICKENGLTKRRGSDLQQQRRIMRDTDCRQSRGVHDGQFKHLSLLYVIQGGLPWPKGHKKKVDEDILDWLQSMFAFQKDNVANQREHLILLLANVHIRQFPKPDHQQPKLDDRALTEVMKKLFKNYKRWCEYLNRKSSLWLPTIQQEVQQRKLLYMGLYLLIWGEAANLRFMPECLCYIYHHMAFELYGMLAGSVSPVTGETVKPAYGETESIKNKRWMGKINFVEIRSFCHIFRSFDRMWGFYILSLQAMIIIAWNGSGAPSSIFEGEVFKKVLSIFITASVLKLAQAIVDIIMSWKARQSMSIYVKLRYILKAVSAAAWVIILPVTYAYSWKNPPSFAQTIKSWFGNSPSSPSLFFIAVLFYLSPNMLSALLFLFPFIRRNLERSEYKIARLVMWWSQPRLYVGRGMHDDTFSLVKYTLFWVLLMASKLSFSYFVEIKPLVGPTKEIMEVHIQRYQWHEFFPRAKKNIGVVIALWAPIILVYFMDTQIWYAIFSTIFGGIYGAFRRLGESLPGAFNARLIPLEKKEKAKKGLKAALSRKFDEVTSSRGNEAARFAQMWNKIIESFRDEDLINNREMNLLLVPSRADKDLEDLVQWPPFLLASKIPIALDMAENSDGRGRELMKRLNDDTYMRSAIRECYASCKSIINYLKENEEEKKDQLVIVLLDVYEVVTRDIMQDYVPSSLESSHGGFGHEEMTPLSEHNQYFRDLKFPVTEETESWKEKELLVLALISLSSIRFTKGRLKKMMILFLISCVLTPYYNEEVLFTMDSLEKPNEDGVSILFYLQKIYPVRIHMRRLTQMSGRNFLERVRCDSEEDLKEDLKVIYRIKLPGPALLGEGKPENQNHAIIFTRGEGLQTIDMNQDNYMEEAFKMRNLLQEFLKKHGVRNPTILGLREHIFTGRVRFHYGHPDVFDRLFHLTRGGVSKASSVINLSEDIFAGTVHQINSHMPNLDIASIFFPHAVHVTSPLLGFYFSTMITGSCVVYVFLYGRLYLVLSGLEDGLSSHPAIRDNKPLQVALASQSFVQIGLLMALPMMMEIGLERGFRTALTDFVLMLLQLAPLFFTFSLGTRTHYYGRTLLHGGAEYKGTGRGFVVFHAKFAENYRLYSRSHFVKGIELMILVLVYHIFGKPYRDVAYVLVTISIWFMVGTWLFAPFLFNPSGFEWQKILDDWTDWNKWIHSQGGIGVPPAKSWESWWEKEQMHLRHSGMRGIIIEILLSLRFFIYQYGLVYHLSITKKYKSILVYGISWLVIFLVLAVMKIVSTGRRKFSADFQLVFRLIEGLIFIAFMSVLITLIAVLHMTFRDIIVCILAFMPTGWGLLLIAQALRHWIQPSRIWGSVRTLARCYELMMGLLLFTPVAFLAWFPFVSEFQTRMLFNQAFSRGLQISRILGGPKKEKDNSKNSKE